MSNVNTYEALMSMLFKCIDSEAGTDGEEYALETEQRIEEFSDELKSILDIPQDFNL